MNNNRVISLTLNKSAFRDITQFPDTTQGTAALIAAINRGEVAVFDSIPTSARVGTARPPLTETRSDSLGTAFVKAVAPALFSFTVRLAPRPRGNYYDFAPQTAQETILLSRLPDVSIHPSKTITYTGPYFTAQSDRLYRSKGFTHVTEAVPNFGQVGSGGKIAQNLGFPFPAFYQQILNELNTPGHPDYAPNSSVANWFSDQFNRSEPNLLIPDQAACRLLGKKLASLLFQSDRSPEGCEWFTLNIETLLPNPRNSGSRDGQVIDMLAYLYQGTIDAAIAQGRPFIPKPLLYDAGNLTNNVPHFEDRTGWNSQYPGMPRYFDPLVGSPVFLLGGVPGALLFENHPLATVVKNNGASIGNQSYARFTHGNETLWQKNGDGTFKKDSNGNLLYRTDDITETIFGQPTPIAGYLNPADQQANHAVNDRLGILTYTFSHMAQVVRNFEFLAGGGYLTSNTRQSGWSLVKSMSWGRPNTELPGDLESIFNPDGSRRYPNGSNQTFNARPRNPEDVQWESMVKYMFTDVNRWWDQGQASIAMGGTTSDFWKGKGVWEHIASGIHRASELNWIFDTSWQLIQPLYFVKEQELFASPNPEEHYCKKLQLVGGRVRNYQGKAYIWMMWRYPAQDVNDLRNWKMWFVAADGVTAISPAYRLEMAGRWGGIDYWQIDDQHKDLPPSRMRFQGPTMVESVRTLTGDYRDARIANHPTPPNELESYVPGNTTTPVTPVTPAPVTPTPVTSTNPMPEVMLGLYPFSTAPFRYQTSEDPTRFTRLFLDPIPQNDGIPIQGLSTNQNPRWIPPYLTEFAALNPSAPDTKGFYFTAPWSDWDIDSAGNENGTWLPGAQYIFSGWKTMATNYLTFAKNNNMKAHIAFWPGRNSGFGEYLPASERPRDHNQELTNAAVDVPAMYLYSNLLRNNFDVNNIDTTTSVGKFFSRLKNVCAFLRPYQIDGSLTNINIGTHTNGELAWNTRQDNPGASWTGFSAPELAHMRADMSARYSGNIGALNARWGTSYNNFSEINYDYTGDFNDFANNRKSLDLQRYGHRVLGDAIELFHRVIWSELPGLLITSQFGQPKGGQGPILRTIDIPYLLGRANSVRTLLGSGEIGLKYNPGPTENNKAYASLMKYIAYQVVGSTGKVFLNREYSYEASNVSADLTAQIISDAQADALSYGKTSRTGDGNGSAVVLWNTAKWGGFSPGGPVDQYRLGPYEDPNNSVKAGLSRLYTLDRRRVVPTSFGTTDPAKTVTITMNEILDNIFVYGGKFNEWESKGGQTQDVAFKIIGFDIV